MKWIDTQQEFDAWIATMASAPTLAIGSTLGMDGVESARSATSTSLWSSCADRWPVLQHHGRGERGRLHRR